MMDLIIAGTRRSGKSMEIIKYAAENGLYVVVADNRRAESLYRLAYGMGIENFKYPLIISELPMKMTGNPYKLTVGKLVVDDADDVLSALLGMDVVAMTATTNSLDLRQTRR